MPLARSVIEAFAEGHSYVFVPSASSLGDMELRITIEGWGVLVIERDSSHPWADELMARGGVSYVIEA